MENWRRGNIREELTTEIREGNPVENNPMKGGGHKGSGVAMNER
jgi:hypothetical protein